METSIVPNVDFFAHKVHAQWRPALHLCSSQCKHLSCNQRAAHIGATFFLAAVTERLMIHIVSMTGARMYTAVSLTCVDATSVQLKLGKGGIEEYLPIGSISDYEQKALDEAVTILQGNISKGKEFANAE